MTDFSGRRRRCFTAAIGLAFGVLGCGGGGAAIDAGNPTGPGPAPELPAPPATPSSNVVTATGASFSPATITIAQGASVTWQIVGNTHNVTFGTNKPTGGDAPNATPGSTVTRTFATAGPYPYKCTLHSGMVGTVVVQGATAPVFTSVAVTPATPGVNVGATAQLTAAARDQDGSAMAGYPAATWASSNASVATVNGSGVVTGVAAGAATITTPNETFSPRIVTIGPGGTVTWQLSGAVHNVIFGTLKPAGGDIPNTDPGNAASRTFATLGTYDHQCTRHSGMTGQVVVTWEFSGGSLGIVFEDAAPPGGNIPESSPGSRVSRTFPTAGDYDYHSSKNRDVQGRIRVLRHRAHLNTEQSCA